jgi:glycosyltransferase involved in cell wall biosynthesis
MVLTRPMSEGTGRTKTMRLVHEVLSEAFDVEVFRLESIVETRRASDLLGAFSCWAASILLLRPLALQCVLFATRSSSRAAVSGIANGGFDAVYVDMARCQYFLRRLKAALPSMHVVVDLDDLLSRRSQSQARSGMRLTAGFISRHLPRAIRLLFEKALPSGLVYRYESGCLERAEQEMLGHSGAAVLVSPVEREILGARVSAGLGARIHAITPPARILRNAPEPALVSRFVFVGADTYQPNRLAIDRLLDLWRALGIGMELHIYGRQERVPEVVPGVHWHGFITDIADAYVPGSVALAPLPLAGGIKTKVVEAWSFGCPVLGTPEAMEGLCGPDYPLCQPLSRWPAYLLHPAEHQAAWATAARMGQAVIAERLAPEAFRAAWLAQFQPVDQVS